MDLAIPEPQIFLHSDDYYKPPDIILMGPGPSNPDKMTLAAHSQDMIGHMHPETFKLMDEVKLGLQYAFQTKNKLTLCVSGTGHSGMETVFCNLIEEGDKVLIATNGEWGRRAADIAERYGAQVKSISARIGEEFKFHQIEDALRLHRPHLLFIVHGESSTGVVQELEGLGKLCHRYDCLLVVDAVASLGGVPLFMDKWEIDAIYSCTQKVLAVPPGITPISFSPRAQKVIENRESKVRVYYFDMGPLGDYWDCWGRSRVYHHTIPVTLLYALHEGLRQLVRRGLNSMWSQHSLCANRLRNGLVDRLGLELFVKNPKSRLDTVTTVILPSNCDFPDIVQHLKERYRIEISGGLGPTSQKVFRVGLMGGNATIANVELILEGLRSALHLHSKI